MDTVTPETLILVSGTIGAALTQLARLLIMRYRAKAQTDNDHATQTRADREQAAREFALITEQFREMNKILQHQHEQDLKEISDSETLMSKRLAKRDEQIELLRKRIKELEQSINP